MSAGSKSNRSNRSDRFRGLKSAQLEEQLVKKRQAEYERLNFWNNNCTYFKTWDFHTALHSNWVANENSCSKMKITNLAKTKQEILLNRRKKLQDMLASEDKMFNEELEKKKKKPILKEDLNIANIELLVREEEARRKERDLKMYHHWRLNEPCFRDFERKQHHDYVKKSWIHQVAEKRKEKEEEKKKIDEYVHEIKLVNDEFDAKNRELKEEKRKTELELKSYLQKQIDLAKCKEDQEKILRSEELETVQTQLAIENMIEERKKLEEKRKIIDLSLFNRRQYQMLLKKRAKETMDNILSDKKFLDEIANEKKYECGIKAERLEKFKKELQLARDICQKQEELEKLRSFQAQYLFDEEAKQTYEIQEKMWKKENDARQKLLNDVLKTLHLQIKGKLMENLEYQNEVQKERDLILKAVEKANKELESYQEKAKESLDNFKKNLDQQIIEKNLEVYYRKKKLEEEKENELRAKKEEEERLCKELYNMYVTGFQTKPTCRKRKVVL